MEIKINKKQDICCSECEKIAKIIISFTYVKTPLCIKHASQLGQEIKINLLEPKSFEKESLSGLF